MEQKAIDEACFNDGVKDLVRFLDSNGIKRAVVTRNVQRSVMAMQELLWDEAGLPPFFPAVSRDAVVGPPPPQIPSPKPSPEAVSYICEVWGCVPQDVVFVGDSEEDDIVCAYRAGCGGSVLLDTGCDNSSGAVRSVGEEEVMERVPTVTVRSFDELLAILNS